MKIIKSLSALVITSLLVAMMLVPAMAASAPYATVEDALAASGFTSLQGNIVPDAFDGSEGFANEEHFNLFDGDTATKFCTGTFPLFASWEMDKEYVLNGAIFATANDNSGNAGRNPNEWTISGSSDNSSWEVIASGTYADLEDTDFTYYTISFNNDKAFKFYRFDAPDAENFTCFQMSEIVPCGAEPAPVVVEEVAPVEAPAEAAAPVEAAPAPVVVTAPQTADFVTISAIGTLLSAGAAMLLKRTKR